MNKKWIKLFWFDVEGGDKIFVLLSTLFIPDDFLDSLHYT